MSNLALRVHPGDDLLVALRELGPGETIDLGDVQIITRETIPQKHKVSLRDIQASAEVRMYGVVVGRARCQIPAGSWVNTERLEHHVAPLRKRHQSGIYRAPDVSRFQECTFAGYRRADGRVGTANLWLVLPLVFCENNKVNLLREALSDALGLRRGRLYYEEARYLVERLRSGASAEELLAVDLKGDEVGAANQKILPHVDGVKFLTHTMGCGGTPEDAQSLARLLAGYIDHPNCAGATVLSLGCQHTQVRHLLDALHERRPDFAKPLFIVEQQRDGTEHQVTRRALQETLAGLALANQCRRTTASLSNLVLGVKCGASDGFSGISANPALGYASDLLIALGGSTVLTEFPELCGVEQELVDRCISDEVAERFLHLMEGYQGRLRAIGAGFDNNPSPGNIRDGLITDAMKSAGAARKGGTSQVVATLDYPEAVKGAGLHLLCAPGNDVESVTALVGAGANLVVFTTGMGTAVGNPLAPVLKVSSNTELYQRRPDIIDLDAGTILRGQESIESVGARILSQCIEVASGRTIPKAVALSQDDFIPWKRGLSL